MCAGAGAGAWHDLLEKKRPHEHRFTRVRKTRSNKQANRKSEERIEIATWQTVRAITRITIGNSGLVSRRHRFIALRRIQRDARPTNNVSGDGRAQTAPDSQTQSARSRAYTPNTQRRRQSSVGTGPATVLPPSYAHHKKDEIIQRVVRNIVIEVERPR